MASSPIFFGKEDAEFLADLGTALLQIKNERDLTLAQMGRVLARCDDMVAKYIAAESEMGVVAWKRANEAWPELSSKLAETAQERAFRARQRILNLDQPARKSA
jgi:hypothetical protein